MRNLIRRLALLGCVCMLSGCGDWYVPQAPVLSQFMGKTSEHIYSQAERAHETGQYNKAISCFRAFIQLYPEDAKRALAEVKLIECYRARGQFKEAIKRIDHLLVNYPGSACYAELEAERTKINRKYRMDKQHELSWIRDIQKKNDAQYHTIEKTLKKLKGRAERD